MYNNNIILKIGLIPIYFDLYDEMVPNLRQAYTSMIKDVKAILDEEGLVIQMGIVSNKKEAEELIDKFIRKKVDIIITLHLCYSPSRIVADSIARINKPVIILDTSLKFGFKNMNKDFLMQNHALPGIQDLASTLRSLGVKYNVITGHYTEPSFRKKIQYRFRILKAANSFFNQRVGITGKPFELMGDFEISKSEMGRLFAAEIINISSKMILETGKKVQEKKINEILIADRNLYITDKIKEDEHKASIKTYLVLKKIIEENQLTAYTMNFQHTSGFPIPFYAVSRLMMDGYGYAGEGDVLTALLGRPLNVLSDKATFGEFFCSDWESDLMIVSHMGETNPNFTKKETKCVLKPKTVYDNQPASIYFKFAMEPCILTFVTIIKGENNTREMVTGILEVVDSVPFKTIDAPHFIVKTSAGINEFREKYCQLGGAHHLYFAFGDIEKQIKDFSRHLNISCNSLN